MQHGEADLSKPITVLWNGVEYGFTVTSYSPPEPGTHDYPGDGGEIDFSPVVRAIRDGVPAEITYDDLIDIVVNDLGVSQERADITLRDAVLLELNESLAADLEDSRESFLEDR